MLSVWQCSGRLVLYIVLWFFELSFIVWLIGFFGHVWASSFRIRVHPWCCNSRAISRVLMRLQCARWLHRSMVCRFGWLLVVELRVFCLFDSRVELGMRFWPFAFAVPISWSAILDQVVGSSLLGRLRFSLFFFPIGVGSCSFLTWAFRFLLLHMPQFHKGIQI